MGGDPMQAAEPNTTPAAIGETGVGRIHYHLLTIEVQALDLAGTIEALSIVEEALPLEGVDRRGLVALVVSLSERAETLLSESRAGVQLLSGASHYARLALIGSAP